MKNIFYALPLVVLGAVIILSIGCKKIDTTTAPTVTLNGAAIMMLSLQGTYSEQGATAMGKNDGAITPKISGVVNVNHTGTYILTYTAIDKYGNVGTAIRTVSVKNDYVLDSAKYTCTISIAGVAGSPYTQYIKASSTVNNRINFGLFCNDTGNTNIYANFANSTFTLPRTLAAQVGNPPADRVFAGAGTATTSPIGFSFTYTDSTSTGSVSKLETFVKQ
jgi:hypothetical protein